MFNAIKYYKDFDVAYSENSKNCSPDFINIQCPFCGDISDHLGFNFKDNYYHCWKCGHHSIYDVIGKLTPYKNPINIIKEYETNNIITTEIKKKLNNNTNIKLPGGKLEQCHKRYLQNRGLDPDYIEEKYKLKGTLYNKKYPYRIIIPIIQNNKVVTYQTRGIIENQRYINCEPEKEIIPIKDCLYNIDSCNEDYIAITEGVFKVYKIGDNSCATLGKNFTNKQVQILQRYKKIFVYFDPDEAGILGAQKLSSLLDSLGKEVYIIDHDIAPDELNKDQVADFWSFVFNSF